MKNMGNEKKKKKKKKKTKEWFIIHDANSFQQGLILLHVAIDRGHIDVAELLINAKADLDKADIRVYGISVKSIKRIQIGSKFITSHAKFEKSSLIGQRFNELLHSDS